MANAGIPGHRGFFAEFGDRLSVRLRAGSRRTTATSRRCCGGCSAPSGDRAVRRGCPLDLFHRLVSLLPARAARMRPGARSRRRSPTASGSCCRASRAKACRHKLRVRSSASAGLGVAVLPGASRRRNPARGWQAGRGRFQRRVAASARCPGNAARRPVVIQQHLENAGVSVDIVFSLEVIDRCLTRTALLTEIIEAPPGAAAVARHPAAVAAASSCRCTTTGASGTSCRGTCSCSAARSSTARARPANTISRATGGTTGTSGWRPPAAACSPSAPRS